MFKGVNRRVVMVRTDRGSPFEAVYMVLKRGVGVPEGDILKEADRIISRGLSEDREKNRRWKMPVWGVFALGALSGAVTVGGGLLVFLLVA